MPNLKLGTPVLIKKINSFNFVSSNVTAGDIAVFNGVAWVAAKKVIETFELPIDSESITLNNNPYLPLGVIIYLNGIRQGDFRNKTNNNIISLDGVVINSSEDTAEVEYYII